MKERWNQEFFWVIEQGKWVQKRISIVLDVDNTTVITEFISDITTSGLTS